MHSRPNTGCKSALRLVYIWPMPICRVNYVKIAPFIRLRIVWHSESDSIHTVVYDLKLFPNPRSNLQMSALKAALSFVKRSGGPPTSAPSAESVDPLSDNSHAAQDIPDGIRRFRTISNMLSYIQHNTKFEIEGKAYNSLGSESPARHQIKICSAFSSLAVMDAEVVSAVASVTKALEVIVCSQYIGRNPSHVQQQQETLRDAQQKSRGVPYIFSSVFGITKNPARDDPKPPTRITCTNVETLFLELVGKEKETRLSDQEIIDYAEQSW